MATDAGEESESEARRKLISRKYLDGHYEECLALVIEQLSELADAFIKPNQRMQGTMFGQQSPSYSRQTRFMHNCRREATCKCVDLLVFYFSLLHQLG